MILASESTSRRPFRPLRLAMIVLALLLAVSALANWYGEHVLLQRYCADPGKAVRLLEEVLTEERPAGDSARTPYLIAAKLAYLLPQQPGEDITPYLHRVENYLHSACR